jgi:transcriptional regulator with XRE-family HTH domain
VIDVATLSVIRRWALREQMSIREISRRTGLARNTVKKYLRAGDEEPRYARRASSSKLDPYADKLSTWLSIEATKSRKQRRTLLQLHTPSLKRRKRSTYPQRELLCSQSGWVSIRWKSRVTVRRNSTPHTESTRCSGRPRCCPSNARCSRLPSLDLRHRASETSLEREFDQRVDELLGARTIG